MLRILAESSRRIHARMRMLHARCYPFITEKKLLIRSRRRGISAAPAAPKHGNNPTGIIVDVVVVIVVVAIPVEPVIVAFSTVYLGSRVKCGPSRESMERQARETSRRSPSEILKRNIENRNYFLRRIDDSRQGYVLVLGNSNDASNDLFR